jgi:hypothetical protein
VDFRALRGNDKKISALIGVNPCLRKPKLKKQSQFVPGLNGATSYMKGDYDKIPLRGARKNKANQSQSPGFARKS